LTDPPPIRSLSWWLRIGVGLLALVALIVAQSAGYKLQRSTGIDDWINFGRALSLAAAPVVAICLGWNTASRLVIAVGAVVLIGYLFFVTGVTYGCHLKISNCL
jgi:hypothetical protein